MNNKLVIKPSLLGYVFDICLISSKNKLCSFGNIFFLIFIISILNAYFINEMLNYVIIALINIYSIYKLFVFRKNNFIEINDDKLYLSKYKKEISILDIKEINIKNIAFETIINFKINNQYNIFLDIKQISQIIQYLKEQKYTDNIFYQTLNNINIIHYKIFIVGIILKVINIIILLYIAIFIFKLNIFLILTLFIIPIQISIIYISYRVLFTNYLIISNDRIIDVNNFTKNYSKIININDVVFNFNNEDKKIEILDKDKNIIQVLYFDDSNYKEIYKLIKG